MHITQYWSENAATTNTLKIACLSLAVTTLSSSIFLFYLAQKPPIVVERACYSRQLESSSGHRTPEEVKSFVHEGVRARFDSLGENPDLLALQEIKKRASEQSKFKKKDIRQTMLVDSLKIEGDKVTVRATRLIALKNIRSAMPFHLEIDIKNAKRTATNPYGLVVMDVRELPLEGEKEKK